MLGSTPTPLHSRRILTGFFNTPHHLLPLTTEHYDYRNIVEIDPFYFQSCWPLFETLSWCNGLTLLLASSGHDPTCVLRTAPHTHPPYDSVNRREQAPFYRLPTFPHL